ncbi:MAG: hypothetical protein IPN79_01145 [Saprospiraceae bacterium]|nr:hypothetical protein [Saprospiraceae bacterium]
MNFKQLTFFVFLIILTATSCKKEVEGCTDTAADNYNADASVSTNTCTYQKRFTGEYSCVFNCSGTLASVFQTADMTVSDLAVKSEVNLIIQSTIGPIPVKGTIFTKDSISIDAILESIEVVPEIFYPGSGTTPILARGTIKSKLGISSDNKTLSGKLNLSMENKDAVVISGIPIPAGTLKLDDQCAFVATKK